MDEQSLFGRLKMNRPKYVKMRDCALQLQDDGTYYRVAGDWTIDSEFIDGILVSKNLGVMDHIGGIPLIEISEVEWSEDNNGA